MEIKTCISCGNDYEYKDPRQSGKYCSLTCYNKYRTGRPRGNYVVRREHYCLICDKMFLVGGRDQREGQVFCSNECSAKARYRRGRKAANVSGFEAAYIAGLIDGEGSIILYMRRDAVAMRIMISNTHRGVLEWVASKTNVGVVMAIRPGTAFTKATFNWMCNAEAAESVLRQIHPYLIIKKPQAELALETQERLRNPQLKADRLWQAEYRLRMKTLNRRGPVAK